MAARIHSISAGARLVAVGLLASAAAGLTCEPLGHPVEIVSGDCVSCHQADYDSARNPSHLDEFPLTCGDCHVETHWRPAGFPDHEWPLEGAHAEAVSASCHVGDPPTYEGTPGACLDCHADDRARAEEPDHGEFSMDCGECHTPSAWQPATFPEHSWPLEGAHATAPCGSCHLGDPRVYAGTPTLCVDCHRDDYDSSPYPGHEAFPTSCQDCHTTAGWTPATGGKHPERAFPITAGAHKVFDCMECHDSALGPNGKDNTDCVGCHTGKHSRAKMDAEHHEVSRYPSGDAAGNFCLDCHPRGKD